MSYGRYEKGIYIFICSLLWIYLWLWAGLTTMTHDEIATFFYYVHTGNFLPFVSHWDANNHFLNSALTWIFYNLFGSSPLVLRLSNLIFAPLFFFYLYKIAGNLSHKVLRWVFIISLCFTQNFLAFFALSRGYGISMALLFAAVWHLMELLRSTQIKHYFLCFLFLFFSVLTNLTLINTFVIILAVLVLFFILNKPYARKTRDSLITLFTFLGIVPLYLFFLLLIIMKDRGDLYGGMPGGFWQVTVKSLMRLFLGSDAAVCGVFLVLLFGIACFLYFLFFWKKKSYLFFIDHRFLFFLLLAGNIAGTIFLTKMFGIHSPEDRMGLFFLPFFTGSLTFLLDQVYKQFHYRWAWTVAAPLMILPVFFVYGFNLSSPPVYKNDNIPERFYDKVNGVFSPGQFPPTIGGDRMRHFCWSYLDFRHGGNLCQLTWETYPGKETDFVIADAAYLRELRQTYDSVDFDTVSGRYLLQRKEPVSKVLLNEYKGIFSMGYSEKEFLELFRGSVSTLRGKILWLGFDLTLDARAKPFIAWITVSVFDSNHKELRYSKIALDWLRTTWTGEKSNFLNSTILSEIPENADSIIAHLWNIEKAPYRLTNGKALVCCY